MRKHSGLLIIVRRDGSKSQYNPLNKQLIEVSSDGVQTVSESSMRPAVPESLLTDASINVQKLIIGDAFERGDARVVSDTTGAFVFQSFRTSSFCYCYCNYHDYCFENIFLGG